MVFVDNIMAREMYINLNEMKKTKKEINENSLPKTNLISLSTIFVLSSYSNITHNSLSKYFLNEKTLFFY
jgi:hypothetical protein